MVSVPPGRGSVWVRLAGHLPPLLIAGDEIRELEAPACPPPGLGAAVDWPGTEHAVTAGGWSVLLFTDGLIEGRIGRGPERLGSDGLIELIASARADVPGLADDDLLERLIDQVRKLNQGDLDDDLAVLALGCSADAEAGSGAGAGS
jgi:serine phosphatase RsbU (regulator of sigma subunit)